MSVSQCIGGGKTRVPAENQWPVKSQWQTLSQEKFETISKYLFLYNHHCFTHIGEGMVWSWSYGSWIYNHLCNQCL